MKEEGKKRENYSRRVYTVQGKQEGGERREGKEGGRRREEESYSKSDPYLNLWFGISLR